jgi:Dolichyl-phosphate-mannose-protein mannosyltransferase
VSLSERRWAWPALAGVLAAATSLRLWGVGQGLPYVYNLDESDHFVPHAVAMFRHGLDPHYFENPPALTYLLHFLFALWFGGASGVEHAYAHHPQQVYVLARVATAVLGTAAIWLLYLLGARLFGRGVGLLAAAIEAVAFLPVFYAHLALNDVPTLAPLTLSLLGTAGVLRRGRALDYLIAGAGLGLACATKYTAGVVLLSLLAATAIRYLERDRDPRSAEGGNVPALPALAGVAIAGAAALAAFLLANPYSLLDYAGFHRGLVHQSALSEAQGKLGAPKGGGLRYYLWSLTWGLGWVPALAALGGALTVWRRERALGWVLVPAAVLFLLFMGVQGRYFGRWLLPIFPILCLLAAFFALRLARTVPARRPRLRTAVIAIAVLALCAQGAVYSIHTGLVLSRADTRNLTRAWMVGHVPGGSRVVVEPVVPNAWVTDIGAGTASGEPRWQKYPSLRAVLDPATGKPAGEGRKVRPEDYERTLSPALVSYYEQHGYCWVVSGSTQAGRAFADPRAVPQAIAYYRTLAQRARVVYRSSPYRSEDGPVPFGFDWSFDYYPLAYERPGPQMTVYRLSGGRCAAA